MKTILVVESGGVVKPDYQQLLRSHKIVTIAVKSINEAIIFLIKTRVDLLVTSIDFSDNNCMAFLKFMRTNSPDLPVVGIVANADTVGEREIHDLSKWVSDMVTAPIDENELIATILNALENGKLQNAGPS